MKILLRLTYRILRIYWFFRRPVTVGVRIVLIRAGAVLLVRHTYQDAWYLPGGGVKGGERLDQAIRREADEEAGVSLESLSLLGVYTNFAESKNDHVAVFYSEAFTLTGKSDQEIERVQFFPLDTLPEDLSPGCLRRIKELQAGALCYYGAW